MELRLSRLDTVEIRLQRLDKVETRLYDLQMSQLEMTKIMRSIESRLGAPNTAGEYVEQRTMFSSEIPCLQ
eukprot:CAMPEP_0180504574 /NCGR_PEP_ID=MMETSP1036_2-20121128/46812_1 /TAXON_ID=632150 /ORGANISM="Azadinium spinosum, Strain 3D9" /LENGTH=70 /DNA_ID=CAMNT_0022514025 /DNA_START=114 /DNA_END=326 /DNA_ORIENTATION=-